MEQLRDLVSRARAGRLQRAEMADPTITVTNLGDLGVDSVYGVIYPPQVAMVGFGRVLEQPWAEHGMLGVRPPQSPPCPPTTGSATGCAAAASWPASTSFCKNPTNCENGDTMNEQDARAAVRAALGKVAPDVELDDVGGDSRLRQDLDLDSLDFLRLVETIDTATGVDIRSGTTPPSPPSTA